MATDVYDRITAVVEKVAAFGGFGAVVGATAAAVNNSTRKPSALYGEWAAYCGALTGVFGLVWAVVRI